MWLLKEKYFGKPNKQFNKDVERLKNGEPVDCVIGFTDFLGCKIDLSKKTLIPRPETEFCVQKAMQDILQISPQTLDDRPKFEVKVLDLFSGSGCIGLSILKNHKNLKVVFAEREKNALAQIKINCQLNRLSSSRYNIIQSDIFSNVKGKFDYMFANPPYIPTTRRSKIQLSVLKFEPKEALFGGGDGLKYIRKFLAEAKNFLKPGGKIFMEFDSIQKRPIELLLKKYGYQTWEFGKDQYGKYRYVVVSNL